MWEDEILEELHRIREEHAKAFNYDVRAICADWRKRQEQSGRQFVTLTPAKPANKVAQRTEQKKSQRCKGYAPPLNLAVMLQL